MINTKKIEKLRLINETGLIKATDNLRIASNDIELINKDNLSDIVLGLQNLIKESLSVLEQN